MTADVHRIMVRLVLAVLLLMPAAAQCQEVLLPASWYATQQQVKASGVAVALPFFDDFSNYSGATAPDRWDCGGAHVNTGFGQYPPTVGMLTLDAYDGDGRLYPQATTSLFPADTAMSLPLRLDSLTVDDSVVMSFYYLPGGGSGNLWERIGDTPDGQDSLFLDFYAAADSQWHTVWCRGGVSEDTLVATTGRSWQYVAVTISDSIYFDSAFRFRFRNYCSLQDNGKPGMAGGGDQWNIDYVTVDRGRDTSSQQPVFRDVAFVEPAPSMLAHYQAMPAKQYRPAEMAQTLEMTIANLYSSALATQYGYAVVNESGDTLYRYDGGYENAPAFLPDGVYQNAQAHASPEVGYTFDIGDTQRSYTIVHTVREGVGGDAWQQNDTVRFTQHFGNYYAYDDGTAENGYGLTSTASRIYLAYRFDLNVQDTLTAVDMLFNRTLGAQNESIQFYLTVWANENGRPGPVLYRDAERRHPVAGSMESYVLEHAVLVEDSIFVGFEQVGNNYINIGFDRNNNSSDRIYYLTSTEWQQSILSGSLLLRPKFGSSAVEDVVMPNKEQGLTVYPNPATERVTLGGIEDGCMWQLYDCRGGMRLSGSGRIIAVDGLPAGMYLVKTISATGVVYVSKIIIRR